jgi:4-amino-4-deoxy-L-arabinose transferase-like glycosyltransferase
MRADAHWYQRRPVLAGVLAAFAWLASTIWLRPLTMPEEGRYASVAWEMLRSGNWLVPTQDGLPFFDKPPLYYWLTAMSMEIFGTNAAAARLAPLLGAMLGGTGLYLFSRRWTGEGTARWTALVLATMPFFFGGAQFANLDLLVAALMALALMFAAHAVFLSGAQQPHRRALLAAWAMAALAVLAKGLIGIVLPGMVIVVWLLVTRQARGILLLLWPPGLFVFALIVVPWFAAVQMQFPGFGHYFFVYQHFERFAASGFNNVHPWWFFIVILPAMTLPWSLWLLRSTFEARPGEAQEATLWRQLMWLWLVLVLAFFSIPKSKPPGYVMAVLFPLAWLIGDALAARGHDGKAPLRRATLASIVVAVTLCLVAVVASTFIFRRDDTTLALELARLRAPNDPVLFVGEYLPDVTLHARLMEPSPVTGNWADPDIGKRDNWRRELAESAPFAATLAARLLVDPQRGFALRCGGKPLWALVKSDAAGPVAALPGAERAMTSNRVELWRVPPAACGPDRAETIRP